MSSDAHYVIGIDLGTTNCAVSYVDLTLHDQKPDAQRIQLFQVPQLTGPGEFSRRSALPSFLYIPGPYDITEEAMAAPWRIEERQREDRNFAGTFARDHGAGVPSRLVASAKSWLCHGAVDRRAPVLPWGAPPEVHKVSPVRATTAYLKHIRKAWNVAHEGDPAQHLEHQTVVITVPASFDEVARELTLEAAQAAGLGTVTLLEEPLAAFYCWLEQHETDWQQSVRPGELILVCDVGGGTTDFTLISLRESDGSPRFERIAVGDHLILGGDNIDLHLARLAAEKGNRKLSRDQWKTLAHQSRKAKEELLGGQTEQKTLTLMGGGSRLIAGTISMQLDRRMVETAVTHTFYPLTRSGDDGPVAVEAGLADFGLPYEPDPAVTRHLGRFLERHTKAVNSHLGKDQPRPDLILFNGGSLKARLVQDQIQRAVGHWFGAGAATPPRILPNPDLDLAVARGAAYYGLVKSGIGVRVGSGSARAFYLGVAAGDDPVRREAVCLVERGLEEGSAISLTNLRLEVLANQPVRVDLFSSSYRAGDRCGEVITVDESLTPLPPVQTVIQYGRKGQQQQVPVQIEGAFTELGTLDLWCRSLISQHRWRLTFELRGEVPLLETPQQEILDTALVEAAQKALASAFTPGSSKDSLNKVAGRIAALVDRSRDDWPLSLLRPLADTLLEQTGRRATSAQHEIRWLNLLGYCLRPGLGEGFDPHRIKNLWKIYKKGPQHHGQAQVRTEWWIMWRRVAAGLSPGQQRQFSQDLSPILLESKRTGSHGGGRISAQERLEMWMAIANLEALHADDKVRWGAQLLNELHPKRAKAQHFWALARLGARQLLYGSIDRVVPAGVAVEWIERLLEKKWRNPRPVAAAVIQMARRTGDQVRDLRTAQLATFSSALMDLGASHEATEPLRVILPLNPREESAAFGEQLPAGIVMRA
ncbi:MAG: Hsp70 family protein [Desulfosarcinaceae bacterium]|nr:Hsp70 family protein [Desulfosarcinaceae bacterium]